MNHTNTKLEELLELANRYPSPHNGQPIVIKTGATTHGIYFDTSRGLTATPISHLFSFVTVGVFAHYLELCAKALGHRVTLNMELPSASEMATQGELHCGSFTVEYDVNELDSGLATAIAFRQTSRKKYTSGLNEHEQDKVRALAAKYGTGAVFLNDVAAKQTIWLNQRAVFDDMFDKRVRNELRHWIRFNHMEKVSTNDGLSYDCMELSGSALKFVFRYYRILHWPVVAPLLQRYYLRTMQDKSDVGYVTAPFTTEHEAYNIGRYIIEMWIELSKSKKYLHPFGTVVSNSSAHNDFAKLVGLEGENRGERYIVFIFRAGQSERPVRSERISVTKHLAKGESNG